MRISSLSLPVVAISLTTILFLPAAATAQQVDDGTDPSLMASLQQVIALQQAWMAEHQCYCSTYDLAQQFDGQVLDDDMFPASGGVIRQFLSDDGQTFILIARDLSQWQYITAASSGDLFQGHAYELDQTAYAAIDALVWAERAMYASTGRHGSFSELQGAGLLGEHWTQYLSSGAGEVALFDSGVVLTLALDIPGPGYQIVAEGGSATLDTDMMWSSVRRDQISLNYGALLLEKARNSLRTVISANAAYYATYGYYATLPVMAEDLFLGPEFGETDPADLGNGIRMFVVVPEDGQAYRAVSAVMGVMYYGDESGEIRDYAIDEPVDDPEIEALRMQVKDLLE